MELALDMVDRLDTDMVSQLEQQPVCKQLLDKGDPRERVCGPMIIKLVFKYISKRC